MNTFVGFGQHVFKKGRIHGATVHLEQALGVLVTRAQGVALGHGKASGHRHLALFRGDHWTGDGDLAVGAQLIGQRQHTAFGLGQFHHKRAFHTALGCLAGEGGHPKREALGQQRLQGVGGGLAFFGRQGVHAAAVFKQLDQAFHRRGVQAIERPLHAQIGQHLATALNLAQRRREAGVETVALFARLHLQFQPFHRAQAGAGVGDLDAAAACAFAAVVDVQVDVQTLHVKGLAFATGHHPVHLPLQRQCLAVDGELTLRRGDLQHFTRSAQEHLGQSHAAAHRTTHTHRAFAGQRRG